MLTVVGHSASSCMHCADDGLGSEWLKLQSALQTLATNALDLLQQNAYLPSQVLDSVFYQHSTAHIMLS